MNLFLAYVKNKGTETIRAFVVPCVLLLAAASPCVVAQEPATAPAPDPSLDANAEPNAEPNADAEPQISYVLTRSGSIVEGKVADKGNAYSIEFPGGGSLSASKLDVLCVSPTREGIFDYRLRLTRMEDVNEALKLADWANRRRLGAPALKALQERLAVAVDDAERAALQKKIDEIAEAETFRERAEAAAARIENERAQAAAKKEDPEIHSDPRKALDAELDAWGRTLPTASLEKFSRKALPVLQKRCATTGCHDEITPNARYVVRKKAYGPAQRLALLYNLRETMRYLDFDNIDASPIVTHPAVNNAMGKRVYPFGEDKYSTRDCAYFIEWLNMVKTDEKLKTAGRAIQDAMPKTPQPRQGAASRYDLDGETPIDMTLAPDSVRLPPQSPEAAQSFAELFQDDFKIQQGFARGAEEYLPNPYDDVNSPESALRRVGLTPQKEYRDSYDPAIFNDKFHPGKTAASQLPKKEENSNEPPALVDVTRAPLDAASQEPTSRDE